MVKKEETLTNKVAVGEEMCPGFQYAENVQENVAGLLAKEREAKGMWQSVEVKEWS